MTVVKPHLFVPDPDIGPAHDDRHTCAVCRMLGRPDDARHTPPDTTEAQDAHRRRIGEDDDL